MSRFPPGPPDPPHRAWDGRHACPTCRGRCRHLPDATPEAIGAQFMTNGEPNDAPLMRLITGEPGLKLGKPHVMRPMTPADDARLAAMKVPPRIEIEGVIAKLRAEIDRLDCMADCGECKACLLFAAREEIKTLRSDYERMDLDHHEATKGRDVSESQMRHRLTDLELAVEESLRRCTRGDCDSSTPCPQCEPLFAAVPVSSSMSRGQP